MDKFGRTIRIPIGPLMLKLSANLYKSDAWIGGYYSRVGHNAHMLMVDVDDSPPTRFGAKQAIEAARKILTDMELSHIAVLATGNGYHIVSADIGEARKIVQAYQIAGDYLRDGAHVDYRHLAMGFMRTPECWTLRIGEKNGHPVRVIHYEVTERISGVYSLPHYCLIETIAGRNLKHPAAHPIECAFTPVVYRK